MHIKKLKLCLFFVSSDFPNFISGIGDHSYHLHESLANHFSKSKIITSEHRLIIEQKNIQKVRWSFPGLIKLFREVTSEKSIVLIQYPGLLYGKYNILINLFIFVLNFTKVKVFIYLHEYSNLHILRKVIIILSFRYSDRIIVTTKKEKEILLNVFKDKVEIVEIFPNLIASKNIASQSSNIITYFGMVYPDKRFEEVIRICSLIEKAFPRRFKFRFLVGRHKRFQKYWNKSLMKIETSLPIYEYYLDSKPCDLMKMLENTFLSILRFNDGISLRRGSLLSMISFGIPILANKGSEEEDFSPILNNGVFTFDSIEEITSLINQLIYKNNYYNEISNNLKSFGKQFSVEKSAMKILNLVNRSYVGCK